MPSPSQRASCFLALAVGLAIKGCAFEFHEVTPLGNDVYKVAAHHTLFLEDVAQNRALGDAEEFCAEKNRTAFVQNIQKAYDPYGVYVHVWFSCVES